VLPALCIHAHGSLHDARSCRLATKGRTPNDCTSIIAIFPAHVNEAGIHIFRERLHRQEPQRTAEATLKITDEKKVAH
jgi:hypothetical protein